MSLKVENEWKSFGGVQRVYSHDSRSTLTPMKFAVYTPPQAEAGPVPVLYYLSGLTCTWENVTVKGGIQRAAAEHGVMIVAPDTSPRGPGVPDEDRYDFGTGAGFYVDATASPWNANYRMYSYVSEELPTLIDSEIPGVDPEKQGVFGHSMGGHGALTVGMKNPDRFQSISAFSPIVSPMACPWGRHALSGYLGDDEAAWPHYDACKLVASVGWKGDILIDQGTQDEFLETELLPHLFADACRHAGVPLTLRMQDGYDHSYYFIASFMDDHVSWHAERLAGL